jgi:hypothetical protein
LAKSEKHTLKLQTKLKKKDIDIDKITLLMVLDDLVCTNIFGDFLEQSGRDYYFQFYRMAEDFREEFHLEGVLIFSVQDTIDPILVESWDWFSIVTRIRDLWTTFFAPDSNLNISGGISSAVVKYLEVYYNSVKDLYSGFLVNEIALYGVKAVMIAEQEVLDCKIKFNSVKDR